MTEPKPLTEKELEQIEGWINEKVEFLLKTLEGTSTGESTGDESLGMMKQLRWAIQELKRLRAGPMQAREKILRDAIIVESKYLDKAKFEDFDEEGFNYCMGMVRHGLGNAIREADEIKDRVNVPQGTS